MVQGADRPGKGNPVGVPKALILVVDDNPLVLKLLDTLFEEEGIAVELAANVPEAKQHLEGSDRQFDLVLSDIQMPGETGFDLLQWIKKTESPYAHLPVLLTTAELPQAEHRLKGLSMGAVDYVVRPIELKELVIRSLHAIENYKRIRTLELNLQNTENLAMMGTILAAAHHEIKNLVTLVKLSTDQLTRLMTVDNSSSAVATVLQSIKDASSLLTDVARNMAQLTDPIAQELKKPLFLSDILNSVSQLMGGRVKPTRMVLVPPSPIDDIWVLGHDVRIKQVLINLIINAQDAILQYDPPEGGKIVLNWHRTSDGFAEVSVIDNGIGLSDPGEKSQFQAFSSTKRLRGGQGLGLWLCSKMAANLGGGLVLASQGVGLGARAKLRLPLTDRPSEPSLDLSEYLDPDTF
jgi:C4-dicarboxylate-specific signal transduction histidine kinase